MRQDWLISSSTNRFTCYKYVHCRADVSSHMAHSRLAYLSCKHIWRLFVWISCPAPCGESPRTSWAQQNTCFKGIWIRDLRCRCCFAGLPLFQAELCRSVHSARSSVPTGRTSPNSVAPHHSWTPSSASSDLTPFLLLGNLCPAQEKTAPTPKCNMRRSCLQEHRPSLLYSARNLSVLTVGST